MEDFNIELEINQICRTCLSKDNNMQSIFEVNVANMLSTCSFIQVSNFCLFQM